MIKETICIKKRRMNNNLAIAIRQTVTNKPKSTRCVFMACFFPPVIGFPGIRNICECNAGNKEREKGKRNGRGREEEQEREKTAKANDAEARVTTILAMGRKMCLSMLAKRHGAPAASLQDDQVSKIDCGWILQISSFTVTGWTLKDSQNSMVKIECSSRHGPSTCPLWPACAGLLSSPWGWS